jgi:hypothetical protein
MPGTDVVALSLLVAAFAGGVLGAALGALRAFAVTGALVVVTELWRIVTGTSLLAAAPVPEGVAFGPLLAPYVAIGGGTAAAAYAVRKGHLGPDTEFPYHPAKRVAKGLWSRPAVLAVGGVFGVLGYLLTAAAAAVGAPWDPVTMGVVVVALCHRVAFGYRVVGFVQGDVFDMTPFERAERRVSPWRGDGTDREEQAGPTDASMAPDGGIGRYAVEPWLPHQFRWPRVAGIGLVVGALGAVVAYLTASAFLAFGLGAASLLYLETDVPALPVTHHVALPASTAVLAVVPGAQPSPADIAAALPLWQALALGAAFGLVGALAAEVSQRLFYAHGDTYFDPSAASILVTSFLVAVLALVGVFPDAAWVPTP